MLANLIQAEANAAQLFLTAEERNYFQSGQTEKELNDKIYDLAFELFGIRKFWHKRIIRSGPNTLLPYRENPPNRSILSDDILFVDFGPVFEDWEADFGRTYVVGDNPLKLKLQADVETAWNLGKDFFVQNYATITGAQLYEFTQQLAVQFNWEFGHVHCGHLIGQFPHEEVQGEETINYLHPDNHSLLSESFIGKPKRYWIYEIHFVDKKHQIGGFFEQLLAPPTLI